MIQSDEKSQSEARDYVLNKPLNRPNVKKSIPVILTFTAIAVSVLLGYILSLVVDTYIALSTGKKALIILTTSIILFLCTLKHLLVVFIKCYQNYASEFVRRSCLCKPTCSEYAIIVLKKYCLFKALKLIYVRLFKTCSGKYKIDYPDN